MSLYGQITHKTKNSGIRFLLKKPSNKAEIKKYTIFQAINGNFKCNFSKT